MFLDDVAVKSPLNEQFVGKDTVDEGEVSRE
jgi:hypothetical protein